MNNRQAIWIGILTLMLSIGTMVTVREAFAIGEVTPTPSPMPEMSVEALTEAAIEAIQSGDMERAIELMSQALEMEPDRAEAYVIRGIANAQTGRFTRAIDDYTRAIELMPYDWATYTYRGDAYALMGDPGQAMIDYNYSVYLNPRYEQTFVSRALLNTLLEREEAAQIDELIASGLEQASLGNTDDAIENFSRAINVTDEPVSGLEAAYYNRALLYYTSGDLDAAIADYDAALEIDSDMHDSLLARGIAYREKGQLVEAGQDFVARIEILESSSFEDTMDGSGTLDIEMAYGSVYRIRFEGEAGQQLTLAARDPEGMVVDPLIALQDPQGQTIAGDDDFGGELDSMIEDFELPQTGTYTLIVSHANGGFEGLVRVSIEGLE